jgi:hypothetical protein
MNVKINKDRPKGNVLNTLLISNGRHHQRHRSLSIALNADWSIKATDKMYIYHLHGRGSRRNRSFWNNGTTVTAISDIGGVNQKQQTDLRRGGVVTHSSSSIDIALV